MIAITILITTTALIIIKIIPTYKYIIIYEKTYVNKNKSITHITNNT